MAQFLYFLFSLKNLRFSITRKTDTKQAEKFCKTSILKWYKLPILPNLRNIEKLKPSLYNQFYMKMNLFFVMHRAHWCKERRIKRKRKKILHAWNELSTQDWTTLRFVLGNIWGLTLAKVLVKKFFLKFIHPNRHTHHGVCFSLLPHFKPYPSTKKLLYKGSYKTVLF